MPNLEEHCKHSQARYGVRAEDIHSWIDEPSQVVGSSHRIFRHDINSMGIAVKIFGQKYGPDMVENIFLDHLKADSEEARRLGKLTNSSNGWTCSAWEETEKGWKMSMVYKKPDKKIRRI